MSPPSDITVGRAPSIRWGCERGQSVPRQVWVRVDDRSLAGHRGRSGPRHRGRRHVRPSPGGSGPLIDANYFKPPSATNRDEVARVCLLRALTPPQTPEPEAGPSLQQACGPASTVDVVQQRREGGANWGGSGAGEYCCRERAARVGHDIRRRDQSGLARHLPARHRRPVMVLPAAPDVWPDRLVRGGEVVPLQLLVGRPAGWRQRRSAMRKAMRQQQLRVRA